MRFMLLIHGNESSWGAEPEAERGHYVAGDQLEPASSAKLVRVRDRQTIVSDGPFAETQEQFGGCFLVDCDLDTALAYAARIPAAEGGAIEVRPLVEDA